MKTRYLDNFKISLLLFCTLIASYSFICMTKNCFSAAMVFIVDEGYMTKFETGAISAVFYTVYAALQIVGGMVTDKWHPEKFLIIGFIGGGIANLLVYFFYQHYVAVLIIWALNAVVQFGVWPATFKLITTLLHHRINMVGIAIATFSNPFGVMAGFLVAALVPRWQDNFLVSGIGLLLFALFIFLIFKWITPYIEEKEQVEVEYPKDEKANHGFFGLVMSSGLIFLMVITLVRTMFDNGLKSLMPSMINESYEGLSPDFSTILSIVVLLAGVLGPITAQAAYPRIFKNEVLACSVFLGIAVPFAVALIFIGEISYLAILLCAAMIVLCTSAAGLFTTSYIAARFNKWGKGATVAGLLNCLASLGIVATNLVFTALADGIGWKSTAVVWVVLISIVFLLSVITVPIWQKFKKHNHIQ